MKKKIPQNNEVAVAKLNGRFSLKNAIIAGVFILIAALVPFLFSKGKTESLEQNTVNLQEAKNSPTAAKVETQNIYYFDTPKKVTETVPPPRPIEKVKKKPASTEGDVTINADNAKIVTNNQSGGSNTYIEQIPEPELKMGETKKKMIE